MVTLRLRPADAKDRDFVLACRNDPDAVAASGSRHPVSAVEHAAWFSRALMNPLQYVYVVEGLGMGEGALAKMGTGRLDLDGYGGAELSLTLLPAWRGQGYGRHLVAALLEEAARLGATSAHAWVRPENTPSVRAFLANDFHGTPIMLSRRVP